MKPITKECRVCLQEAEHGVENSGKVQSRCRACVREYSRRHYQQNKAAHNKRRNQNRYGEAKAKKEWLDQQKSIPCKDCGVQYPPHIMQFDHLDAALKQFTIGKMYPSKSMEDIKAEVAKCEVVCANCHIDRTWRRAKVYGL